VKLRIQGTKNIAKITKSMKMVSAAKLRGDQSRLNAVRPFAVSLLLLVFVALIFSLEMGHQSDRS
jgi:F0F1-type ATP synthase gamma subunit